MVWQSHPQSCIGVELGHAVRNATGGDVDLPGMSGELDVFSRFAPGDSASGGVGKENGILNVKEPCGVRGVMELNDDVCVSGVAGAGGIFSDDC